MCAYAVLAVISNCYPPVQGRLPTRYSPVRHSVKKVASNFFASFDLHVLSTPPAFILSQDQTLMLWFVPVKINFLANFSLFTVLGCLFRLFVLKFFRIFRVVILFSYQCSFSLFASSLNSACISYQSFNHLSSTFLTFLFFSKS